jgi:hypothetical protein
MSSSTGRHDDWRGSRGERDGRGSAIDQMGARVNGGSMDEAEYRPRPRTATAPQPDRHHSSRSNHPPTARYPSGASTSSNRMESGAMRRDRGRRATDVASTNAPYDRRNRGSSAKRGRPNTAASSVPAAPPMLDASPMPGHAGHAAQPFPHRGDGNPKRKKGVELETDPVRLAARQKKIDYGKNTTAYDAYLRAIPKYVILCEWASGRVWEKLSGKTEDCDRGEVYFSDGACPSRFRTGHTYVAAPNTQSRLRSCHHYNIHTRTHAWARPRSTPIPTLHKLNLMDYILQAQEVRIPSADTRQVRTFEQATFRRESEGTWRASVPHSSDTAHI